MMWWSLLIWMIVIANSEGSNHGDRVVYTALQGDLLVPIGPQVQAVIILSGNKTLLAEWKRSSEQTASGNASFSCGIVHRAGLYTLSILSTGLNGSWIDHRELRVRWPPVSVQTPSEMTTFHSPFHVKIHWIHLKCYPPQNAVNVTAKLVHCGWSDKNGCNAPFRRSSQPVRDIWQVAGLVTDVRFDCNSLDHPGFYRVLLTANADGDDVDDVIGTSKPSMKVRPNGDFRLQVRSRFALPCRRELPVFYRKPQQCMVNGSDRIRMYGKSYRSNLSFTYDYIGERMLESNKSAVSLPCKMLDDRNFDWLCFRYVHSAPDGASIETAQSCIPNHNSSSVFQEPGWGPWSQYSDCTARCGVGVRYRYRYCDRPPPQYTGSFCIGSPVESENCQMDPCPSSPESTTIDVLMIDSGKDLTDCQCGCVKELEEGSTFSLVVSTGLCPDPHMTWIFTVPSSNGIWVELEYLRLDCHIDDVLLVRDGGSPLSPLLAKLHGKSKTQNAFESTSSTMLISIELANNGCVSGFVANLKNVQSAIAERAVLRNKMMETLGMIPPPVMAISSLLLLILCAVFILTMWYTQCFLRMKPRTHSSLRSEESNYHFTSTATSFTSLLPSDDDDDDRHPMIPAAVDHNERRRLQQSLPNSPHLHRASAHVMSRSSTMSPRGFRHHCWKTIPVEIEMARLSKSPCTSEETLKEKKVLNTQLICNGTSRSTLRSYSTDVDLELDYYDLDVRNAGCNAPDSFLRCLADDSTYWNETVAELIASPSPYPVVEKTNDELPFADDEM